MLTNLVCIDGENGTECYVNVNVMLLLFFFNIMCQFTKVINYSRFQ